MKKIKNKKEIIIIVVLIILLSLIIVKTDVLGRISEALFREESNALFSYFIYDNKNEDNVRVLAMIKAENKIEYIEKNDGTKIYGNGKNEIYMDCSLKMNEDGQIKIKEDGKGEISKTIKPDNALIENTAVKLNMEYGIDGYRVLSVSKQEDNFSEYNNITYQIGENGTWNNYNSKFPVVDYDVIANGLNNEDNTVTITARITNPKTNNSILLRNKYNLIETIEDQEISADSLINAVDNVNKTGTYNITVEDQTYNTRIYCFNESINIDVDTTFGSENDVSTGGYAKNMLIIKVDGDINNNAFLSSYASKNGYGGPKGMFIYSTGNIINSGTISMTARGAKAEGQDVYLWKNTDASYEYVPAVGGAGGAGVYSRSSRTIAGNIGQNGTNRQTGGGASGQAWGGGSSDIPGRSGSGSPGTSYSGGSGGGSGDQGNRCSCRL